MPKAAEMEPGKLYLSSGKKQYRCRLVNGSKPDLLAESVKIKFYDPDYNKSWMQAEVPGDYKVSKLLDENGHEIAHDNSSSGPEQKATSKQGNRGAVSGLKMLECWGKYFRMYIDEVGGRGKIISGMLAEFPDKVDSINKWVDAYKSYYNMGKLPGCVKQEVKKQWK